MAWGSCHLLAKGKGGASPPLLLLILLSLVVSGWMPASAQAQRESKERPSNAGVYRRPLGHDPSSLDPARVRDIYSLSVSRQIFDGLVEFDQTLAITPALAEFWKASRDGLVWTFVLRKGVKFHHGRDVTADDVVYSFTRILDPKIKSAAADLFAGIKGAREFREGKTKHVPGLVALDRYTIQILLNEAPVPFVSILAVGHAKIVPKEIVEQQGEGFGAYPIGTGPFKFIRWERGKEIVLTANPDYFDGSPKLARLVYRIFPGEQFDAMYDEFQKGSLEDTPIPSRDYRRIVAGGNQVYVKRPMLSVRFFGLNTRMKPLDDRRLRQALIYAVDRDALIQEVLLGRFTLARGVLPPGTQGFNPHLKGYPYDPQKARELLAQAGYPGGRGLSPVTIWSSVKREEVVQALEHVKKYWQAVGVAVEIQYLTDWPSFFQKVLDGKLPAFVLTWYADVPDPDSFLFKLFHSRSPRNFFQYSNPVVDDLLTQARNTGDLQRRVELSRKAEQLILDDAPLVPVWHDTYERLFQPYVKNVEVNSLGDPYIPLRKIWLERPR